MAKDGKYQNTLVSRLVNTVMFSGKKSTAQRIVYGAFETISAKNPDSSPIEILQRAVDNAKPRIETKARRVGGATYQVPLEIPAERQNALALRWIVDFADAKKGVPMKAALATEIMEAFAGQQGFRAFPFLGSFSNTPRRKSPGRFLFPDQIVI